MPPVADLTSFFRFALEHISEAVLAVTPDGTILAANASAGRILGRPAEALANSSFFKAAPEMNEALWRELWKEIRATGTFAFEFTLARDDGRSVQIDMTVGHFQSGEGELACVTFRDVQERKRLQSLHQEFVSTVSHELRTPMTVIREGLSQILEGLRGPVSPGQARALTLSMDSIDRLCRIIEEMLDLSKIESGKFKLRRTRVEMAGLARDVAAGFQDMAKERRLDLCVTTPGGPVFVYADRDRMIQTWTNLLTNAFKFTETGRIDVSVAVHGEEIECRVEDTGVGLDKENVEKVFNKFEQLGQPSVTGEKGTGLGLAICRSLVELHRGQIWAESEGPGRGARFVFRLPVQNGMEEFRDQVGELLQEVVRRGGSLSAFRFVLTPGSADAIKDVLALVREHVARQTSVIVEDDHRLYVAVPSVVKREGVRMAERIVRAVESGAGAHASKAGSLSYAIASYPEDAAAEEEFMKQLFVGEPR